MSIRQTNLGELTEFVHGNKASFGFTPAKQQEFEYSPMFMPVSTEGKPVLKVQTREKFLKDAVKSWRSQKIGYALGIAFGIAALLLLSVNWLFAVAAGAAAGWFYGGYVSVTFYFENLMKKRPILEAT